MTHEQHARARQILHRLEQINKSLEVLNSEKGSQYTNTDMRIFNPKGIVAKIIIQESDKSGCYGYIINRLESEKRELETEFERL